MFGGIYYDKNYVSLLSRYVNKFISNKNAIGCKGKGVECEIWAISEVNLQSEIEKCDVLLLGPQVRYILSKAKDLAAPHGIPVEVINMMDYGRCNGKAVLERALELKK